MITKLAGALLDFQDDPSGEIIKILFPTAEDLPDLIKTADLKPSETVQLMPNDRFALLTQEDGQLVRKFACVDPGSTVLQALYYTITGENLPPGLKKQAESRFTEFGDLYGVGDIVRGVLFDQEKIALSMADLKRKMVSDKAKTIAAALLAGGAGAAGGGVLGGILGRHRERAQWNDVSGAMAGMGDPAVLVREQGRKQPFTLALADALGNYNPAATYDPSADKTAGVKNLLKRIPKKINVPGEVAEGLTKRKASIPVAAGAAGIATAGVAGNIHGRNKERREWNKASAGLVGMGDPAIAVRGKGRKAPFDVVGKDPTGGYAPVGRFLAKKGKERQKKAQDERVAQAVANLVEKRASDKWPMSTPEQIKQASKYYEDYGRMLHPLERRRFSIKLAHAMNGFGIPVPTTIAKLASLDIDPMVLQYIDHRVQFLRDPEHVAVLQEIRKEASAGLPAAQVASLLLGFDENTGLSRLWDAHVPDPFFSTFGNMAKIAQEATPDPVVSFLSNPSNTEAIDGAFGPGSWDAFQVDPFNVYNSLPAPQKQIVDQMVFGQSV